MNKSLRDLSSIISAAVTSGKDIIIETDIEGIFGDELITEPHTLASVCHTHDKSGLKKVRIYIDDSVLRNY